MAGVPVGEIPAPDELARIIDGIIRQRLVIAISEDESHLKLEQQKLALQSERRRKRWQNLKKWGHLINSWTWATVLMGLIFCFGVHAGLNILPKGVICEARESLCYFMRFDGNKRVIQR